MVPVTDWDPRLALVSIRNCNQNREKKGTRLSERSRLVLLAAKRSWGR